MMRMFGVFCSIVSLAAPGLYAGELSAPLHTADIVRHFGGQAVPKSERGFLLAHDFERGAVFAWDRSGKLVLDTTISPPGAAGVRIADLTVSPKGTFAAAASAINQSGARSSFIVWLGASGKIATVVEAPATGLFGVSFADDGTLWVLLREYDRQFEELPNYDMLRHYDENGRLLETALPRRQFSHYDFPAPRGGMTITKDKIGVYVDAVKVWIELSHTGKMLGRWSVPANPDVYKVVMTASGDVYLGAVSKHNWDFGIYRFDKSAGALERVGASALASDDAAELCGSDGDDLVLSTKMPIPTLIWAKPSK